MDSILESVSEFIGKAMTATLVDGSVLILAGEIRLAALRKASRGSVRLTSFTERMTKSSLTNRGGLHGTGKKSH